MAYQVFDLKPATGMSRGQSNEHLRNFTAKAFEEKRTRNFDPSREHLNFEIMNGKVVPVQWKYPIDQRIKDNLQERGIKDPNVGKSEDDPKLQNTVINIIFEGSRDRMRKMAFGDQEVIEKDMTNVPDNSNLKRMPEIELWAKDMYAFAAKKFGEKNIAAFVVHLDEKNPHVHCTVIPTGIIKGKERISYSSVMGKKKYDVAKTLKQIHDELAEVNAKWGLERGRDITTTGARHRTTEEYWAWLTEQCSQLEENKEDLEREVALLSHEANKLERKVNGLTTMTENLQNKCDNLQQNINDLEEQKLDSSADKEKIDEEITRLKFQLNETKEQLEDKQEKLREAADALDVLAGKRAKVTHEIEKLESIKFQTADRLGEVAMIHIGALAWDVASMETKALKNNLEKVRETLPPEDRHVFDEAVDSIFEDTIIGDMAERASEVIAVASSLFLGYVDAATQFAQGHGGGGGGSTKGWGKKKDEDDRMFMGRCFFQARAMLKPRARSIKRGMRR